MERSASRRAAESRDDEDVAGTAGSVIYRLADRAIDNPALSGGLIVMALTAMAIVSNAVLLQSGRHPDPLFMTRPSATSKPAQASDVAVPLPRPRAEPPAMPPLPRAAPPQPAEPLPAAASDATMIAELQRALASQGLYKGAVDGIPGSRTKAAIVAYEKAEGLPVSGKPSPAILDHIRTASIERAAPDAPAAPAAAMPEPVVIETPPVPDTASASPLPATTPEVAPDAVPATPSVAEIERGRYREVQEALNQIGYGPVPVDGEADEETTNAIRRFELDNGLPITGRPVDQVIERLVAIGAIRAT